MSDRTGRGRAGQGGRGLLTVGGVHHGPQTTGQNGVMQLGGSYLQGTSAGASAP
eukprot:SAG25_NODE_2030_length_2012_cov_4.162572_1_plen_53_part_10